MRVAGCRHIALRLVHDDIHLLLSFEPFSVEADVIGRDVYLRAKLSYNFTVHCNHTGKNEIVGFAA